MNTTLIRPLLAEALGWTLLHSLWQGLLIAIILLLILRLSQSANPKMKYYVSVSALILMVVWMVGTFSRTYMQLPEQPKSAWSIFIPSIQQEIQPEQATPWWSTVQDKLYAFIQSYAREMTGVWLFGVFIFGARWIGSVFYTYRIRHIQTVPALDYWQQKVDKLSLKMHISKKVRLVSSARVDIPMVIGHVKPVILFPVGMISGLAPEQVEAIIAHELAHVKRYDFVVNLLLSTLEVLLFYHPVYWWISSKISEAREHCCDDIAVATCGNARLYAEALYQLEEKLQQTTLAMALQGRKHQLLNRIKRICLGSSAASRGEIGKAGLALGLLLAIAALTWFQIPDNLNASHTLFDQDKLSRSVELWNLGVPDFIQGIDTNRSAEEQDNRDEEPVGLDTFEEVASEETSKERRFFEGLHSEWDSVLTIILENTIARIDTPPPLFAIPPIPPVPPVPVVPPVAGTYGMDSTSWEKYEEQMETYQQQMGEWGEKFEQEYGQRMEEWTEKYEEQHEKMGEEYEKYYEDWAREFEECYEKHMQKYEEELEKYEEKMEKYEENIENGNERAMIEMEKALREQERMVAMAEREMERAGIESMRGLAEAEREILRAQREQQMHIREAQLEQHRQVRSAQREIQRQQIAVEKAMRAHPFEIERSMRAQQAEIARVKTHLQQTQQELEQMEIRLRAELIKDGIIDDANKSLNITIRDKMSYIKINGTKLSGDRLRKYQNLLKQYGVSDRGIIKLNF